MRIFTLCGESSGDLYAWLILKDAKHELVGIGGARLKSILKENLIDDKSFNILGIMPGSILKSARKINSIRYSIIRANPDLFLPVGYPGLNLPLGKSVKRTGIPVYYLLPPQIWAWGRSRKNYLRKFDMVISVFPFENNYLKGVNAIYVGNPLVEFLRPYRKIKKNPNLIGLMPGSRPKIINRNTKFLFKIAAVLKSQYRFRVFLKDDIGTVPEFIEVYRGEPYAGMRECSMVIVKLGTASLEAAILGIPQIAFFLPSKYDNFLRPFLRTNEFSIVNWILGRKEIKYFISPNVETIISKIERIKSKDLYPELKDILNFDRTKLSEIGL